MRLQKYYQLVLRRDIAEKLISFVPRDIANIVHLEVFVSCSGLRGLQDTRVIRAYSMLEMLSGFKGNRNAGVGTVKHGSYRFNSMNCNVIFRDVRGLFNFSDAWTNANRLLYELKGGECDIVADDEIKYTMKNVGDYSRLGNRFYRFTSVFCFVVRFDGDYDTDSMGGGLRLV